MRILIIAQLLLQLSYPVALHSTIHHNAIVQHMAPSKFRENAAIPVVLLTEVQQRYVLSSQLMNTATPHEAQVQGLSFALWAGGLLRYSSKGTLVLKLHLPSQPGTCCTHTFG